MASSKLIAGTMGVFLVGIVGTMGVFLPNYSEAAKNGEEARRILHSKGTEHTAGGMWKNLNDRVKTNKEIGDNSKRDVDGDEQQQKE